MPKSFDYVIEHMEEDDEQTKALPRWVELEYAHMLTLIGPSSRLRFTSLSASSIPALRSSLAHHPESGKAHAHTEPIMSLVDTSSSASASASAPASSTDKIAFSRVCLLDPRATKVLAPEDAEIFDCFLYGGILGDDPPRDRTAELRKLGFEGRHLGPKQMTTDTAVGVTKKVVEDGIELDEIPYIDFPTISFNKKESIEMPFRYVSDDKGEPILPPGMKEHLKADLDRTIDEF
ncbi:SAM-dependent RNA methyltransferase [Kockovaella imperatae]|uniref:SAM-dependent RNA methyltransferase n=1 Tax=Kockovaella imperatae TaxID=4999 RepID=A0A1Y1U647_9TREE|nr:SAM-dependent RNA methyltransferase [Kockovaella imperatae]ORX33511.1 SAM-dependent RNA methyltransferase [Kockovaella imperatae]